jgi:hypothetical protein
MAGYVDIAKDLSERLLDLTKPAQDASVEALAVMSEMVGEFIPSVPVPASVPGLRQVVSAWFDLSEALLGSQREYALRVLEAIAPIISKYSPDPAAAGGA